MNVFGSPVSDDIWIRYTMSDNGDPILGHVLQWYDL